MTIRELIKKAKRIYFAGMCECGERKFDCPICNCSIMATRIMKSTYTTEEEVKALADKMQKEHIKLHEYAELGKKFKSIVKDIEGLWKEKV